MFATAAAAILLLLHSALSAQVGQGAQQGISLETRIAQLQQEVRADPRNPDLHFELSKLYEEDVEKYYDEALSEFGLAVDNGLKRKDWERNNSKVMKLHNKGVSLFEKGKYDKAIEVFESALERDTNNPLSYNNLGSLYLVKGDLEKAREYMLQAVNLYPTNVDFHMTMGEIYIRKGDFKLALLNYNKIGQIKPKYDQQYFGIAKAYRGLGQYSDALGALDKLPKSLREHPKVEAFRQECVGLLNN